MAKPGCSGQTSTMKLCWKCPFWLTRFPALLHQLPFRHHRLHIRSTRNQLKCADKIEISCEKLTESNRHNIVAFCCQQKITGLKFCKPTFDVTFFNLLREWLLLVCIYVRSSLWRGGSWVLVPLGFNQSSALLSLFWCRVDSLSGSHLAKVTG